MKKIIVSLALLMLATAVPALAAGKAAGDVGYTGFGVDRTITFDVREMTNKKPAGGTLHYQDATYEYTVDVKVVSIVGDGAYFAGLVTSGNIGVGSWLYAVVHDIGTPANVLDTVAGNFMSESEARSAVSNHWETPNYALPFLVTSGDLVVHGGSSELGAPDVCTKIQSGTLVDSKGNLISTGYDAWGYNYQAHMFLGYYGNAARPATPVDSGDTLIMKWNDAWLSNGDCDKDGLLDRHYGYPSYIGSGAWLTNHMWGTYEGSEAQTCDWNYFVKIVAVPSNAVLVGGNWQTASGVVIGPSIWGEFAIVQEISNDPCAGQNGLLSKSAAGPGFGQY
jgi:hypothetical protein